MYAAAGAKLTTAPAERVTKVRVTARAAALPTLRLRLWIAGGGLAGGGVNGTFNGTRARETLSSRLAEVEAAAETALGVAPSALDIAVTGW